MESQNFIKYELVDPVSNRSIMTESRDEAIAYYEKGRLIYEHHVTISIPSPFVSTQQLVTMTWNNNPYFEV
jgi:hypothetical protein